MISINNFLRCKKSEMFFNNPLQILLLIMQIIAPIIYFINSDFLYYLDLIAIIYLFFMFLAYIFYFMCNKKIEKFFQNMIKEYISIFEKQTEKYIPQIVEKKLIGDNRIFKLCYITIHDEKIIMFKFFSYTIDKYRIHDTLDFNKLTKKYIFELMGNSDDEIRVRVGII